MKSRTSVKGFTIIELVTVIVITGVIAGILTPFISHAMLSYTDSRTRNILLGKGRLSLERMARDIRQAVPNSISILNGNTGIEFLRAHSGGRYVSRFDNYGSAFANNGSRLLAGNPLGQLYSVGTGITVTPGDILVIGNTSPTDLLGGASGTAATVTGSAITNSAPAPTGDGSDQGQIIAFSAAHQFPTDSPGRHFSIADRTIEIGKSGNALYWHSSSGLNDYDAGVDWSTSDPVLIDNVSAITFTYTPGTPQATGIVRVDLQLTDASGQETLRLYREIHIRNTP